MKTADMGNDPASAWVDVIQSVLDGTADEASFRRFDAVRQ